MPLSRTFQHVHCTVGDGVVANLLMEQHGHSSKRPLSEKKNGHYENDCVSVKNCISVESEIDSFFRCCRLFFLSAAVGSNYRELDAPFFLSVPSKMTSNKRHRGILP